MKLLSLISLACLATIFSGYNNQSELEQIKKSKPVVLLSDGTVSTQVSVSRKWDGNSCRISITNNSAAAVKIKEVILFTAGKVFAPETPVYAEGFQLLSQTGGTL